MDNTFTPEMVRDRMLEEQAANAKAERERRAGAAGEQCAHDYALQSTHYERTPYPYGYCVKYTRLDIFFCRHCLDQKEKTRTATVNRDEPAPPWFIH